VAARLEPIRDGRYADAAFLVAVVVGLLAATVHPLGLAIGGALVGFVSPTLRRAVVTGLLLGFTVLAAFLGYLLVIGALHRFLAMAPVNYLTVAVAVLVPTLAAVALRGLTAVSGPGS
jgi:uncharacterized membrane protein